MSETIAITGKSVKLFKGHYTRGYAVSRAIRCSRFPRREGFQCTC
ncbi:MAG: hypothetical protein ACREYE_33375 [Gammaproteobacteria bacterium]